MGPLNQATHEAVPVPGTARIAEGPDAGQPAPLDSRHPVAADCSCGGTIRRETWVPIGTAGEWRHVEVRHGG